MRAIVLVLLPGCALIDGLSGGGGGGGTGDYRKVSDPQFPGARSIAIADMDGADGADLVALTNQNDIVMCLQIPSSSAGPSFECGSRVATSVYSGELAIADVNNDAKPDIIATGNGVVHLFVNGTPPPRTFTQFTLPAPTPPFAATMIAAGRLPSSQAIAVAGPDSPVYVFRNLTETPTREELTVGTSVGSLAFAETAGNQNDGHHELIVAAGSDVREYTEQAGPLMQLFSTHPAGGGARATNLAIGEFLTNVPMSSEHRDVAFLAASGSGPGQLGVLNGATTGLINNNFRVSPISGIALVTTRIDDDQLDDLAVLDAPINGTPYLRLLTQVEGGSFNIGIDNAIELFGGPRWLAAGDIDRDGKSDFAVVPGAMGGVDMFVTKN